MCAVSMIGDHYRDKWAPYYPYTNPAGSASVQPFVIQPSVSREEFEALRAEVLNMKELLKRAKAYDEKTGQPDCETDDKMQLLRAIAKQVGISLDDVLGKDSK